MNDVEPIEKALGDPGFDAGQPPLEIENLQTHFSTAAGVVLAVDGVSYAVRANEILGVVGESGCGKKPRSSCCASSPTRRGRIVGGAIRFEGTNLLDLTESEGRCAAITSR